MTREHKLALVVGFTLILFVGILLSDHLAAGNRVAETIPVASNQGWVLPDNLDPRSTARLAAAPKAPAPVENRISPPISMTSTPPALTARAATTEVEEPVQGRILAQPPVVAETASAPRAPSNAIHVIKSGETLQDISLAHFDTTRRWREIALLNDIQDASRIQPGQRLRLPGVETSRVQARPATSTQVSTYTVASGDNLIRIARKQLGSDKRWTEIAKLNGITDASSIQPGQVLEIPAR